MPMWTARLDGHRQALSTCTHRWRHSIRHVTRIVTHTMDVNNRHGGSNYRCLACTFTIKRFHNGSCAVGFSLYWSFSDKSQRIRHGQILLMLQPQRQRTVFLTISVFRITSILEWTVTKFKSVQIFRSRNCNELCYTFNAHFLGDFLMHSNIEYQCSSPCNVSKDLAFYFYTCRAFGPCSEQITIPIKSVNWNIWKAKSEWLWISTINCGYSIIYYRCPWLSDGCPYANTTFTMIKDFHLSFRDTSEYMGNNSEWSWISIIIYGYP